MRGLSRSLTTFECSPSDWSMPDVAWTSRIACADYNLCLRIYVQSQRIVSCNVPSRVPDPAWSRPTGKVGNTNKRAGSEYKSVGHSAIQGSWFINTLSSRMIAGMIFHAGRHHTARTTLQGSTISGYPKTRFERSYCCARVGFGNAS